MPAKCNGTIYLVEDDASLRDALARLLGEMGCTVVPAASAEGFLDLDTDAVPACLLLDVRLPGLSGLALHDRIAGGGIPVIFLTGHGDVPMAVEAIKKGAFDFLTKPVDDRVLLDAVKRALDHHRQTTHLDLLAEDARSRAANLTPREQEVLCQVISGAPNKVIAVNLGIALKTVKIHRGQATHKMGAESLVELVHLAELAGLEPDPGVAPDD
jgi:FixJ family two-component response regulator